MIKEGHRVIIDQPQPGVTGDRPFEVDGAGKGGEEGYAGEIVVFGAFDLDLGPITLRGSNQFSDAGIVIVVASLSVAQVSLCR